MTGGSNLARLRVFGIAAMLSAALGCSKEESPTKPPASDDTAPAAVTDLSATSTTMYSAVLSWTAPGDDGSTGTAAQYDIRYSTSPITDADWASAVPVTGEPAPKAAGNAETFEVTYLSANTVYYFALKTADEKPNWSALSNVASDTTRALPDNTPPAAVTDLNAGNATAHSITLTWTAPGDDEDVGTAAAYDIRYSPSPITGGNWASALPVTGEPKPKPAGGAETFDVGGLAANTTYYFALKTIDERPNVSGLSNVASGTTSAASSSWSPLGTGMSYSYFPSVEALIVYDGHLIAGGWFSTAGGVPANMIAAWDGSSWSSLGSGPGNDNDVMALTIYNSRLIAASNIDTPSPNPISEWNGSIWSVVPGMRYHNVFVVNVYDGQLIAGGLFSTAGSVSAKSIAAWNGIAWSALGSGISGGSPPGGWVYALSTYGNLLVAGGDFTSAGGVSANCIAAWNGSSWSPLGSGMSIDTTPSVFAFTIYDGLLIAAGIFTAAGGVPANNIAAWDGSSWSALGSGLDSAVQSLAVYNGRLIAGGAFGSAGGVSANNIAAWNGSSWSPLGSGTDGHVLSLTVYNGQLIAGGRFTTAGGYPVNYIAAWKD